MLHTLVATANLTCIACPEQYEGKLVDGRWFYFRYRSGVASLAVGDDYNEVMGRQDVWLEVGDDLQGCFTSYEQRDRTFAVLLAQVQAARRMGA